MSSRSVPDPDLSRVPLLHFRTAEGIALWPTWHLARLRVESTGRLEATSVDGEVAHRPGPPAPIAAAAGLVETSPGEWTARGRRRPREPRVPGTKLRPEDVLWFRSGGRRAGHWLRTDGTRVPAPYTLAEAHALMPESVRVGFQLVNPRHIRGIQERGSRRKSRAGALCRLLLAGHAPLVMTDETALKVRSRLGIPSLDYLESQVPSHLGLYRLGIREFLEDLRFAPADRLRALFGADERALMANVVWQAYLTGCAGRGTSHRGFWYNPLAPILARFARWASRGRLPSTDAYRYFRVSLELMVQDYGLFTYQRLGFEDPSPELRRIGARHPSVILLMEKTSLSRAFWRLCDAYGCSGLIQRGDAKLIITEYFAQALASRAPVTVIAWVDYDPWGWTAADAFSAQLAAFGIPTEAVRFLVTPARFTPEELARCAIPLKTTGHSNAARVASFMERTGGINGKPLGIQLDALRDYQRIARAFEEESGLRPTGA